MTLDLSISATFSKATSGRYGGRPAKSRTPTPFSLRLTEEERAVLERQAGGQPLGAYIRARLLGDQQKKRRTTRKPALDDQKIAQVLAELGQSRLSANLNQLARAANMGTLDISRDVEKDLQAACAAVLAMREALFIALGLKAGVRVSDDLGGKGDG